MLLPPLFSHSNKLFAFSKNEKFTLKCHEWHFDVYRFNLIIRFTVADASKLMTSIIRYESSEFFNKYYNFWEYFFFIYWIIVKILWHNSWKLPSFFFFFWIHEIYHFLDGTAQSHKISFSPTNFWNIFFPSISCFAWVFLKRRKYFDAKTNCL